MSAPLMARSRAAMSAAAAGSTFPQWSYEPREFFRYEVIHRSKKSNARVGRIYTPHGVVDTPGFVAVGTNAALKALDHAVADQVAGQQLMFCNSYHLLLHPGPDVIRKAGGLHKFMNRDPTRPIITDSGGFQVFSLNHGSVHDELNMKHRKTASNKSTLEKVTEQGATFRSYRDGTRILLTPESSVAAQKAYQSDIIIPLDELPPYHIDPQRLRKSVDMTHRWERRSLQAHIADVNNQAMYAVVHGGLDMALRQLSIDYLTTLPFDGYAVGGSLGKDRDELMSLLSYVMPRLPQDKPNHLLGIADEDSIVRAVTHGVDTFDSCFPTRLGRHGTLLTRERGRIDIRKAIYKSDFSPVDPSWGLEKHSLAYLHHLTKAFEPMAATLSALQNVMYMNNLMTDLRNQIMRDEI